jgi:hypothetical protein
MEAVNMGPHLKMKKKIWVSDGSSRPPLSVSYDVRWLADFNHLGRWTKTPILSQWISTIQAGGLRPYSELLDFNHSGWWNETQILS